MTVNTRVTAIMKGVELVGEGGGSDSLHALAKMVDHHVGHRIKEKRKQIGVTQQHLALALNISYQQVQKYEAGTNRVSAGKLHLIAEALGSDIAWFFDNMNLKAPFDHPLEPVPESSEQLVRDLCSLNNRRLNRSISSLVHSLMKSIDD